MKPESKDCLPLDQVLKSVFQVESELVRFYGQAADQASDKEAATEFQRLQHAKRNSVDIVAGVCRDADCGANLLDRPSEEDLHFLSALTQTAFYRQTGDIAELLRPDQSSRQLTDSALRLERDLMLFYTKFYAASCAAQRPIFQGLISKCQGDIMSLTNLRVRLLRGD